MEPVKRGSATNKQDNVTNRRDSATDRRDNVTDRRDSATNRQDSATDRRDSATKKQDSATDRRDSATKKQDSDATDRRNSATNKQDSATNRRDSITNRRDSATDRRDIVANKQDSATNKQDSATNRRDSATDRRDIATNKQDSDATDRRNSATNKQDSATNRRDSVTNRRDSATDRRDIVTNKQDSATNKQDSATNKQDSATDRRDIATNKQDTSTNKQDKATDKKDKATDKIDKATDKKDKATDKKDKVTDKNDKATDKKDKVTDKKDKATNELKTATDKRDSFTDYTDDDFFKQADASNRGDNFRRGSTVTFNDRRNSDFFYTQDEIEDEESPKSKIEKIEQRGFFRLSEFERGVAVCLVILVIYTVVMSVFYIMYSEGLSHKVHILRVHDDPDARIKFKSLGPPIALIEESFPFIASIIDRVFYDDLSEYKFKCSAVLLKNNTVLAGNTCISNTKYNQTQKVRILSSLWSEIGYLHDILDHKNIKNWFVAIKLDSPFHNLDPKNNAQLLTPEEFKNINKTTDIVTSYCWDHSYFVPRDLRKRKKYDVLSKKELKVARNKECKNYPEDFDGLCAIEHINIRDFFNEQLDGRDSIFLKDSNRLIGIEIKRELWNNSIEHYYQFVKDTIFF